MTVPLNGQKIIDYYEKQANLFSSPENERFYSRIAARLCLALPGALCPDAIIEIGCGSGISTSVIKERFPRTKITAIEPAAPLLNKAIKKLKGGVEFINCRVADLNHEISADLMIGNMTYHWLEPKEAIGLQKKVTTGGLATFSMPVIKRGLGRKFAGNRLLFETYRSVMDIKSIKSKPKQWRGVRIEKIEPDGFKLINREEFDIVEELPAAGFIDVISSRGQLLALFGPKAADAAAGLRTRAKRYKKIEICWPVGIVVLEKTGNG